MVPDPLFAPFSPLDLTPFSPLEHGITPQSIRKAIRAMVPAAAGGAPKSPQAVAALIEQLDLEMRQAAEALEFEKAIALRDQIAQLKAQTLSGA